LHQHHYSSALECSMRAPVVLITLLANHSSLMIVCHSRVAIGRTWSVDAEINRKFRESVITRWLSTVINVIIRVISITYPFQIVIIIIIYMYIYICVCVCVFYIYIYIYINYLYAFYIYMYRIIWIKHVSMHCSLH